MWTPWGYGEDTYSNLMTKKGYFFVFFSYRVFMRFLSVFDIF